MLELFSDESGDPTKDEPFSLTMLGLLAPCAQRLIDLRNELQGDAGLVWGYAQDYPPNSGWLEQDTLPKAGGNATFTDQLAGQKTGEISDICKRLQIHPVAFTLGPTTLKVSPGVHIGESERIYREWLSDLIEAIIFDWLPAEPTRTIRIHCATRVFEADAGIRQVLFRDFSIGRVGTRCYSLSENEVHPIVFSVLARREFKHGLTVARGAQLFYRNPRRQGDIVTEEVPDRRRARPEQIHYLADWVAHYAPRIASRGKGFVPEPVRQWFAAGFAESNVPAFQEWLAASRAAVVGRIPEALVHASEAWANEHKPVACAFSRWVRPKAATWMREFDPNGIRPNSAKERDDRRFLIDCNRRPLPSRATGAR